MFKEVTKLNLTIQILGDVAVLRCAGRITVEDSEELREAVLAPPEIRTVVLDLAGVRRVASSEGRTRCGTGRQRLELSSN